MGELHTTQPIRAFDTISFVSSFVNRLSRLKGKGKGKWIVLFL